MMWTIDKVCCIFAALKEKFGGYKHEQFTGGI